MSGYKQEFLSIKYDYDTKCAMSDDRLESLILSLDTKVKKYQTSTDDNRPSFCFDSGGNLIGNEGPSTQNPRLQVYTEAECKSMPNSIYNGNGECTIRTGGSYSWNCRPVPGKTGGSSVTTRADLSGAFLPIAQYYANLVSIKERLARFLEDASTEVVDSQNGLVPEQRFRNRAHPEQSVKPRELVFGLFSELRPSSVPIVIAAGVFMASLTVLMIFQMFGFTGQINIPPALTSGLASASSSQTYTNMLYSNPAVLGGGGVLIGVIVAVATFYYFKPKLNQ